MNTDVEKIKVVFGVSEIIKKEKSIILGSKSQGIICWMDFEEEACVSLRIKTPDKGLYYYPVNTSVQEMAAALYNMLPHEPAKGAGIWYEEELKNLDKKAVVEKDPDDTEKPHGRRNRRRRR
ncbi:MAG: hypothetical protein K5770_16045 [Lachnospiraceae bacterium]|nr:hypothetical protein [Lachnospiraceae bacterium]